VKVIRIKHSRCTVVIVCCATAVLLDVVARASVICCQNITFCTQWCSLLRHCATCRKVGVRLSILSLKFFIDIILPAALRPWIRYSLYNKWIPGIILGGVKCGRCVLLKTWPPSWADWLEIWLSQHPGTLRVCPVFYKWHVVRKILLHHTLKKWRLAVWFEFNLLRKVPPVNTVTNFPLPLSTPIYVTTKWLQCLDMHSGPVTESNEIWHQRIVTWQWDFLWNSHFYDMTL
jgi:hypothetical protein